MRRGGRTDARVARGRRACQLKRESRTQEKWNLGAGCTDPSPEQISAHSAARDGTDRRDPHRLAAALSRAVRAPEHVAHDPRAGPQLRQQLLAEGLVPLGQEVQHHHRRGGKVDAEGVGGDDLDAVAEGGCEG